MSNMQKTYPSKGDCVSFQIYLILYHIVHKCTVVSCLPGQKISPTPTTGEQNSLKRDPILMSQSRQMGVDLRIKSVTFTSDWEGGVERAKCEALAGESCSEPILGFAGHPGSSTPIQTLDVFWGHALLYLSAA